VRSLCLKTVIAISLSLLQHSGFSQSTFKNGIFLELGGSGALYSINYERQLPHGLVARLGFTYLPNHEIGFPITIGKVFWKRSHHLEIDAGVLVGNSPTTYNNKPRASLKTLPLITSTRHPSPKEKDTRSF
jgi:hypothetical protein